MEPTRYWLTLFLLFLLITKAAGQTTDPETTIAAWEKMWNTYNLAWVDRLFVTDQPATYFSSEYKGLISGIEALRAHHAKFGFVPEGKQTGNKLWLEEVQYYQNAQTCLVTATWFFQRAESAQYQSGPVTFFLVKQGSDWRIRHAHFSNNP